MSKKMSIRRMSILAMIFLVGCVSPPKEAPVVLPPDSPDPWGGISSADVAAVASQMTPAVLSIPEVSGETGPVIVKISGVRNNSRFFIDGNIFIRRLASELNRYGNGRIRFLNNDTRTNISNAEVTGQRLKKKIRENIKNIALEIASSSLCSGEKPIKIAVLPALNSNLVNMNADSFTAMLRSEIFGAAAGKVQFLLPGATEGADYYLTGQFFPESIKTEGIINLAEYIGVVDAKVKAGQPLAVATAPFIEGSAGQIYHHNRETVIVPGDGKIRGIETHLMELLRAPEMRKNPNVNKMMNVMLVDAKSKASVYEKLLLLDQEVTDRSDLANYVMTGTISGMSKRFNGDNIDYLLISFKLTDPETNIDIWENAYEVKYLSRGSVVYK